MKILFIGCVESSKQFLEKLIELDLDITIVGVITKKKSNFNSDFFDLVPICVKKNIDYFYTKDINDYKTECYIKSKEPDVIYCFGWSQLIKENILKIPKNGVIGFHPANIPQNRGRHPIIWALVLGLKETASTFFIMDVGADSGDIISQEPIIITDYDDARSLYEKIVLVAKKQIEDFTEKFIKDNIKKIKQYEEKSSYWRKRTKKDGIIDWRMSSRNIYNLIRALTRPYAGASFYYRNLEVKVWKAKLISDFKKEDYINIEYGKVIKVFENGEFIVKTGDGIIQIVECDIRTIIEGEYL